MIMIIIKPKHYIVISCFTGIMGILYYAWQEEWLIIRHPSWQSQTTKQSQLFTKKKCSIFTQQHNKWEQEQIELIWSDNDEPANIKTLTQSVLTLFFEEQSSRKKIYVTAVLKTNNDFECIISFDRSPFSKQMSIRQKLMIIESILKTLRENGIKANKFRFLANHQPLTDPHLDFSEPWPLEGFLD